MTYLVFLFCFLLPQSVAASGALAMNYCGRQNKEPANYSWLAALGFCRIFPHSIVAMKSFFFFFVKTQTVNPLLVWQLLRLPLREGPNGGTSITQNTSLF